VRSLATRLSSTAGHVSFLVLVEHVQGAEFARIVITHGTDTMAPTACARSEIADKTVVLTGTLVPARFSESDAAFSPGLAFATAQTA
jgi:L-asparaginase